jgi:transcriptional regulator with XRE-family HTH domain
MKRMEDQSMKDLALPGRAARKLRMRLHEELSSGLTLQELADTIGVTQGTLSMYENEKRNLKPEPMRKLIGALMQAIEQAIQEDRVKRQMEAEERNFIRKQLPVASHDFSAILDVWAMVGQAEPAKRHRQHAG